MSTALEEQPVETAVEKAGNGVMVGYFFAEGAITNPLAEEPNAEKEQHLTLLYFGKDEIPAENLQAMRATLRNFAASQSALAGNLDSLARFSPTTSSDNQSVIVLLANVPGLETLRETLRQRLAYVGMAAKANNGFIPHVTLAYVPPEKEVALEIQPQPFSFDSLVLAVGGKHEVFPLTQTTAKRASVSEKASSVTLVSEFSKVDTDKQYVFGWASIVEEDGTPLVDRQGDVISEADMESAAYEFVLTSRRGGEMHMPEVTVGQLIESCAFTLEKQEAMGISLGFVGWWLGFHITDSEAWTKVKSGDYSGFSIHGEGIREAMEE